MRDLCMCGRLSRLECLNTRCVRELTDPYGPGNVVEMEITPDPLRMSDVAALAALFIGLCVPWIVGLYGIAVTAWEWMA